MARAPKGGVWFEGRFFKGGQFLPKASRRHVEISEDQWIHRTLAELPTSLEAAQAMHRLLRGRPTLRDQAIVDGRRLRAIETLRDRSITDRDWKKWNNLYVATAQGVMP